MLALLALAGCIQKAPVDGESQTVKVGYILPLTGDLASLGADFNNAVALATAQMNDAQSQFVFEAVVEDDACRPENTVKSYDKLVKQDGVVLVGGPACSSPFLSVAPKAEADSVVLLSGSATQADITDAGDYSFRVVPSDAAQGLEAAQIADDAGYEKAAVLYVNNDYGKGLADVFAAGFTAQGGEVVLQDSLEQDGTDFRTQLTKVKGSDADVVYVVGYPKSGGVLFKQARELGLELPLLASEGVKDQETLDVAGDAAEGLVLTTPGGNTDSNNTKFVDAYQAMFGADSEPGLFAAEYYDLANLLMKAVTEVGNDAEAVKAELYSTRNYPGASGKITFDENGDVVGKSYDHWVVKDGAFEKTN
jgi:branched-chain amino acid transport system substrate-binding protein